ncbi:putative SUMO1/Ulp2 [Leptomonas seymouri]|uniref:Putative SUMO1/Ulp2 n=1 Tax=Leptomonas seymouri TaxID=5684 RepID=A0A0N1I0U5_LEPSE|nr:putative SUMO1/Ulp2 [Leptomonas seymouri]|eukprot:KPI84521.1 putative SUMO1/Ulp2 [Leptomonas seymouri]
MSSSPPACGAARSPTIRLPPQIAVPTTALLDARRQHFHASQKAFAKVAIGNAGERCVMAGDGSMQHSASASMSAELPQYADSKEHVGSSSESSAYMTSAPSSSLSSNAVVIDTLVRRYRATESRLDRWRHSIGHSRAAAALRRPKKLHDARKLYGDGGDASRSNALRSNLHHASRSVMDGVLERSVMARAVQSWWRQTWGRPTSAAAGKSHASTRVQRLRHVGGTREAASSESLSWLVRTSCHVLGRLSESLALSSRHGRSSRVEVNASTGSHQRRSSHDTAKEEGEGRSGGRDSNMDDWGDAWSADRIRYDPGREEAKTQAAATLLPSTAAPPGGHSPMPPYCSSDDGSSYSAEDVGYRREAEERGACSTSPPLTPSAEDDDCFSLLSIDGLRRPDASDPSTATAVSASSARALESAEESLRSTSRLLTRSRARFVCWLKRRRHRQLAKRATVGERRWRHFPQQEHGDVDRACDADAAAVPDARNLADFARASSELERTMRQRVPSSWEQTLPRIATAAGGHSYRNAADAKSAPERMLVRAALQRAIASATASRRLQMDAAEGSNKEVDTPHGDHPRAAPLSRAAQQEREHADALARLGESVKVLARLRVDRGTGAQSPLRADVAAVASLSAPSASVLPTILSSRHPTYLRQMRAEGAPSTEQQQQRAGNRNSKHATVALDEADAFRSLLVDTTHTPHDTAVRLAYEEIMREVCSVQVRQEIDAAVGVSRTATDRALSQWVERQLLRELANLHSTHPQGTSEGFIHKSGSSSSATEIVFTGIMRHIRSGVPVSLSCLRLDDTDRRALASVHERKDSDTTAVSFRTAGYSITYRQLASLSADSWLNDQVINNYLQLLCEDAEDRQTQSSRQHQTPRVSCTKGEAATHHRVISMGTHFYAKVESDVAQSAAAASSTGGRDADRLPPLASNSGTLRWLRRRQHLLEPFNAADTQSVRVVLIPVNVEAQHWALVVYYRDDRRWVLYDSMSRADRAQQRGHRILGRLSHVWREGQRHYGFPVDDSVVAHAELECCNLIMAAAYTPSLVRGKATAAARPSPLDSLEPYGSVEELHRAAKRLRHQEVQLGERERQMGGGGLKKPSCGEALHRAGASLTSATTLPSSMLSDTEVEWFTGGFVHAPQQRNGNDCGVFVCQVAWCVAHGVAVSFTQTDVTLLRQVIMLELLSKKLLRRYPTEHTSSSADV